jgi:two-component system response regulator DegU
MAIDERIDSVTENGAAPRIILVDDHASLRESLAHWLSNASFEVVAHFDRADGAVEEIEKHKPDIVLLDIDMPGLEAFRAARMIFERSPNTKIVFLSAFTNEVYIRQVLELKASGYLSKSESPVTIVDSLRSVVNGGVCFSAEVRERLVVGESGATLDGDAKTRVSLLTARELGILRYVARGWTHRQIAEAAGVRPKTIDNHVSNIMNKLRIHDRVELALFAVREGIASG